MTDIDQYTKLLLHMDDSNFTDKMGHTVTNNGVILDTNIKKFGVGSAKLTNIINQYLSIPDSDDWHFGTSDFAIDFWIYINNTDGLTHTLFSQRTSPSEFCPISILTSATNELLVYLSFNNTSWTASPTINGGVLSTGSWNHVALVRNSSIFKLFVNGTLKGNYTNSSSFTDKSSSLIILGQAGGTTTNGTSINGYIDEFRISKGIARWVSDFTPPTNPYGIDKYLIQSKTNVLKTIQNGNIVDLVETTPTEELFQAQGFDNITLINSVVLEPESKILTWTDNTLATKIELKYEISPFRIMDNPTNYNLKMYTDNTAATSATLNYNCESYRPVDKANPQFDIVMYKE